MPTGKILAMARRDAQKFATSGGFQEDITLSTPDAAKIVQVTGFHTGVWMDYDNDGNKVNSDKFHIDIPEQALIDLDYPVRNAAGKVALKNHLVTVKDNTGTDREFVINESHPNGTLGLLICTLGRK